MTAGGPFTPFGQQYLSDDDDDPIPLLIFANRMGEACSSGRLRLPRPDEF
jgi:hypothetical protein